MDLLALFAASALRFEPIVSVASYHWVRDGENERNPGIGLAVIHDQKAVSAIVYEDSRKTTAYVVAAGYRGEWAWAGLDVSAGWMHCATYEGPIIIPTLLTPRAPVRAGVSVLGAEGVGFTLRAEF